MRNGKTVVTYAAETRRALTSNGLTVINQLAAMNGDRRVRARPMLITRYPSAQQQPALKERGIAYADATGNLSLTSAAADLLAGPGRNLAEGEFLLDWMEENQDAWRRQLDR